MPRFNRQLVFNFASGAQVSTNSQDLSGGAFGTLLCPSAVNTKTVQFRAQVAAGTIITAATAAALNDTDLLTTAKTLATGKNALTADEIREVGAAGSVKLYLNSTVASDCQIILLWKD